MRRVILCLLVGLSALAQPTRTIQRELLQVPSRPEVIQRALLLTEGPAPKAVVLMFPGGEGVIGLERRSMADVLTARGNFLVRSAERFQGPDLAVVLVDRPSDQPYGMRDSFRVGEEHAADVKALIAKLRTRYPGLKVFLVGTSRGTVSAAYAGQALGPLVDGVVLTSSVFRDGGGQLGLSFFKWDRVKTPLLLVHHAEDGCPICPYGAALKLASRFPLITVRGGLPRESDECNALSAHGYLGREEPVAQAIRAWILGQPFPKEID